MELRIIDDKNTWNSFIENNNFPFYSFLSSWEWWEFKKDFWFPVLRYGIYRNEELIGVLPMIKTKAKRWTYLFVPHTPLIINNEELRIKNFKEEQNNNKSWENPKILQKTWNPDKYYFDVLEKIKPQLIEIAKKEWASFIRFNPPVENTKENYQAFVKLGFRNAPIHEHAEDTHLLDLTKSEEELFMQIKKKDRYYINRAIKEWVEVINSNDEKYVDIMIKMHQEHSKKVGYHPFSEKYIKNLYKHFPNNINTISTWYNGQIESILMTIKFWKTCVYYVAVSDIKSKKFSPNYLCQWEAIKQAKKDGAEVYNFWWVAPDDNPKHPLQGVSWFKRKWWGYDYFLVHAQDLVVSPKYWITWAIETVRRIKRGYYYKIKN